MPIAINGSGTVTGISVGGLPDGIVDADMLAANAVTSAKIADDAVTDAKQNLSGVLKAWVLFDGTTNTGGNCTINDSFNVSSVTDEATGQYTVNFTNSFSNTNYLVIPASIFTSVGNSPSNVMGSSTGGRQTGNCRVFVTQGTSLFDTTVGVAFIGD